MDDASRYWTICQISLTGIHDGYQHRLLPPAQAFFQRQFPASLHIQEEEEDISAQLMSQFQGRYSEFGAHNRAKAGLCLRCYVSRPILKACKRIAWKFMASQTFSYQELLPFVLNDDGKSLVILDEDDKTQLVVEEGEQLQPTVFKFFAVEVLRTYKLDDRPRMSLENWTYLQTKQQPDLKKFLAEFGFKSLGDWALLNRARVGQLEQLSERDRHLVEVFHLVYRRDRQQQAHKGRCPDPNVAQLAEMAERLQKRGVEFQHSAELIKVLKQVAQQLRQFDIWQSREPLEMQDAQTGDYQVRSDLPIGTRSETDVEEQELADFLRQQLNIALDDAIAQVIQRRLAKLQKSKKYAPFAACFTTGLQLYYSEGRSLKEIGPELGMSSWDQTRRILNPGDLVKDVRRLTVQQLLERILQKAHEKGLIAASPEPDYLRTVTEQVEAFLDAEIFAEAQSEIKAGKNRSLDSEYATHLTDYLQQTSRTF